MSQSGKYPAKAQHIVIAAYGTLGDVYPFLQLGLALQQRGHRITIATSDIYRETLEKIGLTFFPMRPNLDGLGQTLDEFGKKLMDPTKGSEFIYREVLIPNLRDSYADLAKAAEGADLLVTHPLVLAASLLSEKTGIRWISTVLAPLSFSSKYDPSVFTVNPFPDPQKLPAFVVGWIISAIKKSIWHWMQPIQEFRAELGLPPGKDPLFEGQHSPHRVMALFSKEFAKPQRDWP
ncbi:MAG TPA: glycosyltransferase, partial [Patescibacteria group bacterium]|nr:glycosyltransferase [Patescibacteria group bacterium]